MRTIEGIVDGVVGGMIPDLVQIVVASDVETVVTAMVVGGLGGVAEGLVCTVPQTCGIFSL